jgi:hypothetical protein
MPLTLAITALAGAREEPVGVARLAHRERRVAEHFEKALAADDRARAIADRGRGGHGGDDHDQALIAEQARDLSRAARVLDPIG